MKERERNGKERSPCIKDRVLKLLRPLLFYLMTQYIFVYICSTSTLCQCARGVVCVSTWGLQGMINSSFLLFSFCTAVSRG